ncbi:MAG TPA: S41 family peptidase [Candidatus Dojkabacteria bacterium]|nr:S41 family peptidase [Candidatus Dojkabacteria bacterium]HQF36107.1 S41 family peptidase [Candidatus Dojkabacteria bacterium]
MVKKDINKNFVFDNEQIPPTSPNANLKIVSVVVPLLISWIFIFIFAFLIGRSSVSYSTDSQGNVISQNSKTGSAICEVIERSKLFIMTGKWEPEIEYENVDFSLFSEVWYMLQDQYIDSSAIDGQNMKYYAIQGMVSSLGDPYTVFLTPEQTASYNDSNASSFEGIGAQLTQKDGKVYIIQPFYASPARKSGLLPGDEIVAVDGFSVEGLSIEDVVSRIRGNSGTTVVLTIARQGKEENFDVSVVRGKITTINFEKLDEKVGVIYINSFSAENPAIWNQMWDEIVNDINDSDIEKLVIDLRGNPGGFLNSVSYALDDFLSIGDIRYKTAGKNGKILEVSRVDRAGSGRLKGLDIVVLINDGSASASEIFAGAIQAHNKGKIMGVASFGKGSVQNVIELKEGTSIHITIEKWLLPNDRHLDKDNKVIPDIEVIMDEEDFKLGIDEQMERAIEYVKSL